MSQAEIVGSTAGFKEPAPSSVGSPRLAAVLGDPMLALVVAVAVGIWTPLLRVQWYSAHEQYAYVLRTVEWATELRAGELYPRWCPDFYGGYGEPLFLFFGPVIYSIAGFLTAMSLDPFTALKLVILVGSILSGVGTYALVLQETNRRDAALVAAMVYLAAPYRIGDIYDRGDIGEFSCIAVLPVVLALYRAAALEPRPLRARWLAAAAAVVHAVMIMTHPVLGLWGTAVVGVVVGATVLALARRKHWSRALLFVAALACAQGLAAVYVVPALVYKSWTHTAVMTHGFYKAQDHWLGWDELFHRDIPLFHRNFLQVGPLVITAGAIVALGLLASLRSPRFAFALRALAWMALSVALMVLTLRQMSGFWAPGRVPFAVFIQFPWRLLGPVTLTAAIAAGFGMAAIFDRVADPVRGAVAIATGAVLLLAIAWPYVSAAELPYSGVPTTAQGIGSGIHPGTDANEYLPLKVERPPGTPRTSLVAATDGASVEETESDGSHHRLWIQAGRDNASVRLAIYGFPGWAAKTDGPAEASLTTDDDGLLRLRLPKAGSYQIRVWYGLSRGAGIGIALSVLSLAALAALVARGSRFWPTRLPATAGATPSVPAPPFAEGSTG